MSGYSINIEERTLAGNNFREVLYTTSRSQLVIMTLQAGDLTVNGKTATGLSYTPGTTTITFKANTRPENDSKNLFSFFKQVAIEKLFFARNITTALSVGHARGVAMLAIAQAKIPISEYTPNEIKQAVAGYGGADNRVLTAFGL